MHCPPGEKAGKALSPVDTRALIWLAFSRCCLDARLHADSQSLCWNAAAFAATALALARQPPRSAPLSSLSVQVHAPNVTQFDPGKQLLPCSAISTIWQISNLIC